MVRPVRAWLYQLEKKKWHRLDSNLCVWYRIASLSSTFFESSSIQSSNERIEASWANMPIMQGGHFWKFGSITSLATETAGGEILVAFWPKHGLKSKLRVPS